MRTFAVVHNIPAPYRVHMFRVLAERLRLRGIHLHVHFMARSHLDRPHWGHTFAREATFAFTFWNDIGPVLRGKEWHWNPGLVRNLLVSPPEFLLLGGPWDTFTGAVASIVAARRGSMAWLESNTHTPGRITGAIAWVKRRLLCRYAAVIVPGKQGELQLGLLFGGGRHPPVIRLPNLIDEARFQQIPPAQATKLRGELGLNADERLAIWNARLIPKKGVLEFLRQLEPSDVVGWKVLILGEGPLEAAVAATLQQRRLTAHIELRRYVDYADMPALYHAADLMLLPSLEDPNPLSVVEALHAGLPLLVSNRIGNHPEAIEEGKTGWTIDPARPASVREGIAAAMSCSRQALLAMGARCREVAQGNWNSVHAVEGCLDQATVR